jgi:hypothetical protein
VVDARSVRSEVSCIYPLTTPNKPKPFKPYHHLLSVFLGFEFSSAANGANVGYV